MEIFCNEAFVVWILSECFVNYENGIPVSVEDAVARQKTVFLLVIFINLTLQICIPCCVVRWTYVPLNTGKINHDG